MTGVLVLINMCAGLAGGRYGVALLGFGVWLSVATYNTVDARFNESKLVALTIYNAAFMGVVLVVILSLLGNSNPVQV